MNTQTRPHNGVLTEDCKWEVTWTITNKTKYDRPLAPEYFKTLEDALNRCKKEKDFRGLIKWILKI